MYVFKKISAIVLITFVIVTPYQSYALECDLIGSGFDDASYNGTYVDTGVLFRGEPQFYNGSRWLAVNDTAYDPALLYFILDEENHPTNSIYAYRAYGSGYIGAYTPNGPYASGTLTEDCGGGGGEPPVGLTGTSTILGTNITALQLGNEIKSVFQYAEIASLHLLTYVYPFILVLAAITYFIFIMYRIIRKINPRKRI